MSSFFDSLLSAPSFFTLFASLALATTLATIFGIFASGRRWVPFGYSLSSFRARWVTGSMAVAGLTVVIALLVLLLAVAQGFRQSLATTGRADNALVIQTGVPSDLMSALPLEVVNILAASDAAALAANGQPLLSPERVLSTRLESRDGDTITAALRGVGDNAWPVHGEVVVADGRRPAAGSFEVAVGRRLFERLPLEALGEELHFAGRSWPVVGILDASGSAFESEIWADTQTLAGHYQRQDVVQSVTLRLADSEALPRLAAEVKADPRLQVEVTNERQYYDRQARPTFFLIVALATLVAGVMGIGALAGVLNTMTGFVVARRSELSTLRALGFSRSGVALSLLLESSILGAMSGLVGCLLTVPLAGASVSAAQLGGLAELSFAITLSPWVVLAGITAGIVAATVGAFVPAVRAARLPVSATLRG